jgi:hypothetical protein
MKIAAVALVLAASPAVAQLLPPGMLGPTPGAAGRPPGNGTSLPAASQAPDRRAEPAPSKAAIPRGAVLEEVSGSVREVDRKTHRITVDTASGVVTLSLDRNSMVYTATGLGTVLDLAPGQQIRAGRNADFLAYWVQLRAAVAPPPAPAPGTGPAGSGAAPATEPSGPGGSSIPPPGGVPPGGRPVGGATGDSGAPPGR